MEALLLGVLGTALMYKGFGENKIARNNMGALSKDAVIENGTPANQVNEEYATVQGIKGRQPFQSCVDQQGAWISSSLLPKNEPGAMNGDWNVSTPGSLEDKNFLEAGHHFGIDTVGSSQKNANLQLRSEPIIPRRTDISPFLNSSIMPEDHRRRFEIQDF